LIDGEGLPMGIDVHSARPAEVRLIESLLDQHVLDEHAPRLIYDRAADSDPLRDRLAGDGIQLICPHRKGRRKRHPAQDGRVLKRYRQRWKVERTIAWLGNYRRLLIRHERDPYLFRAFVQLACLHRCLHRLKPL
jgi:transposase